MRPMTIAAATTAGQSQASGSTRVAQTLRLWIGLVLVFWDVVEMRLRSNFGQKL